MGTEGARTHVRGLPVTPETGLSPLPPLTELLPLAHAEILVVADTHPSTPELSMPRVASNCSRFNRSPTKYQWHYLRLTLDLARHEYVDFHCAGQEFDVAGRKHIQDPPLVGWRSSTDKCPGLVGCQFVIQTNSDERCFLYLDSVVASATAE